MGQATPKSAAQVLAKGPRVIECALAWLDTYRRLSKDYEYLPESSEAMIQLAMINLMAHRLTPG
jgi:transposase